MYLWHWKIIPYLPQDRLRMCLTNIYLALDWSDAEDSEVRILQYSTYDLRRYLSLLCKHCKGVNYDRVDKVKMRIEYNKHKFAPKKRGLPIFFGFHTDEFLKENILNLKNKYESGKLSEREWKRILSCAKKYKIDVN